MAFVRECSGTAEVAVVAHSWGGVIALAAIAVKRLEGISCIVFFGSKRHISVTSLKKVIMVDLLWRWMGKGLAAIYRYYPAKLLRIGSDNETAAGFAQTDQWVREKEWRYFRANLDIRAILHTMSLPPILSLTGSKDEVLGHPQDVQALLTETGQSQINRFILAGRKNGFAIDYDHVNILTHKQAVVELFPLVYDWIVTSGKGGRSS